MEPESLFCRSSTAGRAGLRAARLASLPAASPGHPAAIPQLSRPSVFSVSRKRSCWQGWLLLPPAAGGAWAPASPERGSVQDGVVQGALQTPQPRGRAEGSGSQSHPPPRHLRLRPPSDSASRAAPHWCFRAQRGAPCPWQAAAAGFAAGWRGARPCCWQAALASGLVPSAS